MDHKTVVVMEGDQTGQELLEEALRVLDPYVTGLDMEFKRFDLSLENRRTTENKVVHEAAAAMKEHGFGIKAATVTPETAEDVGSPNAILRTGIDGTVIVRTGRRIPGVNPVTGFHAPVSVIRMAVDDAYGAEEWREGEGLDELAFRTEKISRRVCRGVAEFAFIQARKMRAKVFGGPKYTVSPIYEGMLKEEMDRAAENNRDVRYDPQLIDATYALLLTTFGEPLVIPTLNRDGDCISDMVLQMFGSIAGAESLLIALDEDENPETVMAEAPHGTAPIARRQERGQPDGHDPGRRGASDLLPRRGSQPGLPRDLRGHLRVGPRRHRTADLGGPTTMTEFTDEVIRHVRNEARGLERPCLGAGPGGRWASARSPASARCPARPSCPRPPRKTASPSTGRASPSSAPRSSPQLFLLAAAGELVGDKLPSTPGRTSPPALIGRVVSGALVGSGCSSPRRDAGPRPAGQSEPLQRSAAAYAGERLRAGLGEETDLPDPVVALVEDWVVLYTGYHLTR